MRKHDVKGVVLLLGPFIWDLQVVIRHLVVPGLTRTKVLPNNVALVQGYDLMVLLSADSKRELNVLQLPVGSFLDVGDNLVDDASRKKRHRRLKKVIDSLKVIFIIGV